jgi:hypothetical protein
MKKIENPVDGGPGLVCGGFLHAVVHHHVHPGGKCSRREAELKQEKTDGQRQKQKFGLHGISILKMVKCGILS